MQRLFVAIDLPESVLDALESVAGGLPGARWVPRDQVHLTLAFIGDVDGGVASDVHEALRGVKGLPFDVSLRGLGHFPPRGEPRVAWAGLRPSEPLMQLQRSIVRALESAGCGIEKRKFHPHVTLARLSQTPPRRLAEWLASNGHFETSPFPVTSFQLYSSHLRPTGPLHTLLESY